MLQMGGARSALEYQGRGPVTSGEECSRQREQQTQWELSVFERNVAGAE